MARSSRHLWIRAIAICFFEIILINILIFSIVRCPSFRSNRKLRWKFIIVERQIRLCYLKMLLTFTDWLFIKLHTSDAQDEENNLMDQKPIQTSVASTTDACDPRKEQEFSHIIMHSNLCIIVRLFINHTRLAHLPAFSLEMKAKRKSCTYRRIINTQCIWHRCRSVCRHLRSPYRLYLRWCKNLFIPNIQRDFNISTSTSNCGNWVSHVLQTDSGLTGLHAAECRRRWFLF